jgi:hypothetical protein
MRPRARREQVAIERSNSTTREDGKTARRRVGKDESRRRGVEERRRRHSIVILTGGKDLGAACAQNGMLRRGSA